MENSSEYTAQRIVVDIEEKIKRGVYKEDVLIPSEQELKNKYSVSRATIRKALSKLVEEQYLFPMQGKGYYVRRRDYRSYQYEYTGLEGLDIVESKIAIMSVTPRMVFELGVEPETKVVQMTRLACKNGVSAAIEYIVVPYSLDLRMSEEALKRSSIIEIASAIESTYNITSRINISAFVAQDNTCNDMKLPKSSKLIRVNQYISDSYGRNIAWGMTCYKPEVFRMIMTRGMDSE